MKYYLIDIKYLILYPNLGGLFRGSFWGGGGGSQIRGGGGGCKIPPPPPPPRLKLVRIMLETANLARKYKSICSFRKYTL